LKSLLHFNPFKSPQQQQQSHSSTSKLRASSGTGGGDNGGNNNNNNNNNNNGDDNNEEEEFLDLSAAEDLAASKGVSLPADYAQAAAQGGLRAAILQRYLSLATGGIITSALVRSFPVFRDRLIADKLFFFKIAAEVAIDSGCATVAEVRKRGDEFWDEFEFYLSDLLVGLVLDVVLVTLIAPVAVAGRKAKVPTGTGPIAGLRKWAAKFPSAMFEKSTAASKYSVSDRLGCYVARGLEYSLAGMLCGFIGQGIASSLMKIRREYESKPAAAAAAAAASSSSSSSAKVAIPPVLDTALVWGMFMALSSNTRYQIVFGLERVVDETIARKVPGAAYFTTLAIRFVNNVIGGEQFIDMARWAGVQ